MSEHADGFPSYRPRVLVQHVHSRPGVFFRKDQRPHGVSLYRYRRLREGAPVGEARRVDVDLRARRQDGEIVGWAARFRATVRERRFYDMEASWRDEQGCLGSQSVTTSFRLVRK